MNVVRALRSLPWRGTRFASRVAATIGVNLLSVLIAACASYHPRPLADRPDLAGSVAALRVDSGALDIPGLGRAAVDARNGLDDAEVAVLAVLNNPILKAARLQRGERRAQLLQAGLLPDPKLGLSLEHPTSGAGSVDAYSLGVSEDIRALRTRGAKQAGAAARVRQIDLEVLWKEWQVAARARELFVQARTQQSLRSIYEAERKLNANRYERDRAALTRGDITSVVSASDLVSLVDAGTRLRRLQRQGTKTRYALHALLGLEPSAKLPLAGEAASEIPCRAAVSESIVGLAGRRPDLIALQAGYQSQEAAVRRAVLDQFPSVSVGITQGRDTEGVATIGMGFSIDLPLFNRNRGQVAIERATREQLRQAYQARLDDAEGEAEQIWSQAQVLKRQLKAVDARLPELARVASGAERAFDAGELEAGTYLAVRGQLLAKQAEAIQLEGELEQARISLETLLAIQSGSTAAHCRAIPSGTG